MPSLQIGTTHLFNCTNINTHLKVTDLLTVHALVGHLLVEWRGPPVDQRARMPARWGIPSTGVRRNGCWTTPPFFGGGVGPTTTLRNGYTCRKEQRKKWGYFNGDTTCVCGLATENTAHMLRCSLLPHHCTLDGLQIFNDIGTECDERWKKKFDDTMMMMMMGKAGTAIKQTHTNNTPPPHTHTPNV